MYILYLVCMHQSACTSTRWRGFYEGASPNFLRYARAELFIAHTDFALVAFALVAFALELYISAKFEQNSENKESAYKIYKVCICHYAYVWKVKRRTLWGILVIPGLCRQSGFRIKNSISDTSHMSCPWSEEDPCYFWDKGQVQAWSLNFALFQHS